MLQFYDDVIIHKLPNGHSDRLVKLAGILAVCFLDLRNCQSISSRIQILLRLGNSTAHRALSNNKASFCIFRLHFPVLATIYGKKDDTRDLACQPNLSIKDFECGIMIGSTCYHHLRLTHNALVHPILYFSQSMQTLPFLRVYLKGLSKPTPYYGLWRKAVW